MRPSRPIAIPEPRDDDFEDVHWALSAANAMWERGEGAEALKWLRRAAGTAADRDADVRAVELFKAAADMASIVDAREVANIDGPTPRALSRPAAYRRPAPRPDVDPPTQRREPRDLVPKVPPATQLTERFGAFAGLRFDESEEETFIRPETMLRRALMAIDPQYAERTDYEYDGVGEPPDPQPVARESEAGPGGVAPDGVEPDSVEPESERDDPASDDAPTEADTQRHRKVSLPAAAGPMPGGLLTLRVAVLPIPEEGEIRLLFLSPGEDPPPGVATALLVPPTQRDAELLAKLYDESDAKI